MKKTILTSVITLGIALGASAQGLIAFDNSTSAFNGGPAATSLGLFYKLVGTSTIAETSVTLNGELLASANGTAGTYNPMTVLASTDTSANVLLDLIGNGKYTDDSGDAYNAPVAGGATAFFIVEVWEGGWSSLAAAISHGSAWGVSSPFSQAVGGGTGTPPSLTAMPSVILSVPEPGTFALAGLGAAALLIFRRRK